MMTAFTLRSATMSDFEDGIWSMVQDVASKGDTYAYSCDMSKGEALDEWMTIPEMTLVMVDNDTNDVVATCYIRKNKNGPGSHVCNCGYIVHPSARGKGLATRMCEHTQKLAVEELGFKAMQFNFVATSNQAIALWERLGFETVGRLPKAFKHPTQGFIDALVMYKWLEQGSHHE
eukprot:m.70829 g.70829  ORF g.70829 m.70829 type:complete len:175 (-) comp8324_c0_seq2:279-803(-)